jgi:2,3-bisphosphoglycerate-dependent phosphoglycerate mutase
MIKLVLLRHGISEWNKENRFTGWVDVDLAKEGKKEAIRAGKYLKQNNYYFDIVYTSYLKRAIRTMWLVLDELDLLWVPVIKSWRLNERHYGSLQGMNKIEMVNKFGEEQVNIWRRSYDIPPPAMTMDDPGYAGNEIKYKDLSESEIPLTESLKLTLERLLPFWYDVVVKDLKQHKDILIVAHGNSLRAIVKLLDNLSGEKVAKLNIPTGIPLVYELDDQLIPLKHYYLGNKEEIRQAIQKVAKQSRKK